MASSSKLGYDGGAFKSSFPVYPVDDRFRCRVLTNGGPEVWIAFVDFVSDLGDVPDRDDAGDDGDEVEAGHGAPVVV
jgi:hypothetical protein